MTDTTTHRGEPDLHRAVTRLVTREEQRGYCAVCHGGAHPDGLGTRLHRGDHARARETRYAGVYIGRHRDTSERS